MDMTEAYYHEYIDNAQLAIKFFLSCRQWDGLNRTEVNAWLENFNSTLHGRYFSNRLISQLIYYSERDLEILLKEGVFNKALSNVVLTKQLENNFNFDQAQLSEKVSNEISKTLFVPLLHSESPYESGNQITRILVQRLGIPERQVRFAHQLTKEHEEFARLIIVDDNIGSGDQCRDFWGCAQTKDNDFLFQWCKKHGLSPIYLVLVGYRNSIEILRKDHPDLQIYCVEELQDEQRVFDSNSVYWTNREECKAAYSYFRDVTAEHGLPLLGHNNLDFAVTLHYTIPDWSLPLFWKGSSDWTILIRRKDSYD